MSEQNYSDTDPIPGGAEPAADPETVGAEPGEEVADEPASEAVERPYKEAKADPEDIAKAEDRSEEDQLADHPHARQNLKKEPAEEE